VLVGQCVGAGDLKRAERYAWKIFGYSSVIILIYASLLFFFSKEFARFFIDKLDVIEAASVYNKFAASVMIFSAAELILGGAFSGAGNTTPTAVIGLPFNLLRIPLCAIFSPLYGLYGIWFAICVTVVLKGVIITIWFKKGNWKKKKIAFAEASVSIDKTEVWREM
jgi:Na+-driven multidrug efflux pump